MTSLAFLFALTSASLARGAPLPPAEWRAGVATVKITPAEPIWMAGR
jgi:hypothetical protein